MTMLDRYDALLLDLDGTVYRGGDAVDGARETVSSAAEHGVAVRFVTNNASRPPDAVAQRLRSFGIAAGAESVNTSAQAAAATAAQLGATTVLVVGSQALADEVAAVGLRPVWDNANGAPDAVVQGLSTDVGWPQLAEACLAINAGAKWVAANTDPTLPTERGFLPGNGSLVAALRTATGAEPVVAGKPEAPLMRAAVEAAGAANPLVIGDRLDTDIAGASAVDADAMLVLSGAATPLDLLCAPPSQRPRYVAADIGGVLTRPEQLEIGGDRPGWRVRVSGESLAVTGEGDPLELLRAMCATAWRLGGRAVIAGEGEQAAAALRELGIPDGAAGHPAR